MEVIWKTIRNFPKYAVNNLGEVKHIAKDSYLRPILQNNGSLQLKVSLYNENGIKCHSIARLVGDAFVDNPHNKGVISHINGDPADNRAENLYWTTRAELNARVKPRSNTGKPIYCVELAKVFPSCKAAVDAFGLNQGNLSRALQTGQRCGGYHWIPLRK